MAQAIALDGIILCFVFHLHEDGPVFRFCELRHSCAGLLLKQGVPITQILQEVLSAVKYRYHKKRYKKRNGIKIAQTLILMPFLFGAVGGIRIAECLCFEVLAGVKLSLKWLKYALFTSAMITMCVRECWPVPPW